MPEYTELLAGFNPAVRAWFSSRFSAPSPPQILGWPVIRTGKNVLILSATGTGKTLAAFLEILNRLYNTGTGHGVQVVYISPLKALNNDIARNLLEPLNGIAQAGKELGINLPQIRIAVRTGDTPANQRQAMVRKPPDILITTPESLYLILSSPRARHMLCPTHTIIIDEIHAMANNKRGVHLSLSMERLAWLTGRSLQRIGLSATQRPLELIANYLGGQENSQPRPVQVVDARLSKKMHLQVSNGPQELEGSPPGSLWPQIHERIYKLVQQHRSTLVFVNTRALAEKITLGLNQLADDTLACTHHGSLSRTTREEVEHKLKKGLVRALVCTSSLELGIDVGSVDLVIQVESPRAAASGLQRVGRSGHVLGATSQGIILAKTTDDLLDAAWVASEMLQGEVAPTHIPQHCLDVLAQHIVSMTGTEDWSLADILQLARRSYCFGDLSQAQLSAVVELLSGRYPARDITELRPKLAWNRNTNTLHALPGTRAAAVAGAGTIPDRAYYGVYLANKNVKIGELEEEFVWESRPGDAFLLGNSIWRITSITNNRVTVESAPGAVPKMPFWNGEQGGRGAQAGWRVGAFWRKLSELPDSAVGVQWLCDNCALDEPAAELLLAYIAAQRDATGVLPSDRQLLLEYYEDEGGDYRIILHSPFGARVHAAWNMAVHHHWREIAGTELISLPADNGIMWRIPRGQELPSFDILALPGSDAQQRIISELPQTALFGAYFRMNAARSLILGRSSPKKRLPLWLQRIKASELMAVARQESEFPIALETFRECLHDVLDLPGLLEIANALAIGDIKMEYRHTIAPSPFARSFLLQFTGAYLYNDDAPRAERKAQFLSLNRELLQEMLGEQELRDLLDPQAIAATIQRRQRLSPGQQARNADELEEVLLDLGDLSAQEIEERCCQPGLLSELLAANRAMAINIPGQNSQRFIAAEEHDLYRLAYITEGEQHNEACMVLLRRHARTHGPFTADEAAIRFGWSAEEVTRLANVLTANAALVAGSFRPAFTDVEWCHPDVLQEMHRRTISVLRQEVEAVKPDVYARFLTQWQDLYDYTAPSPTGDPNALAIILTQLSGVFLPVEVWERDIFPARLGQYNQSWLDVICAGGQFVWVMQPGGSPQRGRLAFFLRDDFIALHPLLYPDVTQANLSPLARQVEDALRSKGAAFIHDLAGGLADRHAIHDALWELALAGRVTNDTFAPARIGYKQQATPHAPKPDGRYNARLRMQARQRAVSALSSGGRWSLLPAVASETSDNEAAICRLADILLQRWGVLTRSMLAAEGLERYWSQLYRELRRREMSGQVRGGYFIEDLGGSQFALPEVVDQLRATRATPAEPQTLLLNSYDPASLFGPLFATGLPSNANYARSPLNYIILVNGEPSLYITGYGRTLWRSPQCLSTWPTAAGILPRLLDIPGHQRPRRSIAVQSIDGSPVGQNPAATQLHQQGFTITGDTLVLWPSQRRIV